MNLLSEWPLVIFTLALQLAVGCTVALLVVRLVTAREFRGRYSGRRDAVDRWIDRPLLVSGFLAAIGLAASLFHLGTPLNALRALSNFGHSWLSREILGGMLFLGLWALTFYYHRRPSAAIRVRLALGGALVLTGLLLIGVMSLVYLLPAQAGWYSPLTPVHFYLSTVLLGTVAIAAHLEYDPLPPPSVPGDSGAPIPPGVPGSLFTVLLGFGLAAIIAQIVVVMSHPATAALPGPVPAATLSSLRLVLLPAAAAVIIVALARPRQGGPAAAVVPPRRLPLALVALVLLLIAETAGRVVFYAAGVVEPF